MEAFDRFWSAYPRRIAKGAAKVAFAKAIRKTTLEVMLSSLEKYKQHKPENIDWCHAATWLNAERWEDEWEPETIRAAPMVRKARSVEEVKALYASLGRPLSPEIQNARSVDDLPVFARMIPIDWKPSLSVVAK